MFLRVKEYLILSTLLTLLSAVAYGQYSSKGYHGGGQNEISDEEDNKYPYQPYGFGYDIEDGYGNKQWRHEKSQQDSNVIGSYGFKDNQGIMREVEYMADHNGFRARIKTNEPGTAPKDPGDVKFEAQPVISSHYRHTQHDDSKGEDYEPKSSVQHHHRVQHRTARMRYAASVPRYTFIPYYTGYNSR